jgi:hypothetical protein
MAKSKVGHALRLTATTISNGSLDLIDDFLAQK